MPSKARAPLALLVLALLASINAVPNFPYHISFTIPWVNTVCGALAALTVPIAVAVLGGVIVHRILRYAVFFSAAILIIPAILFLVFSFIDLRSKDTLQDEIVDGVVHYRLYMSEPGWGPNPPFTILLGEIDTGFGIKLIKRVWDNERYGNAKLRRQDNSTLEIQIDGDWYHENVKI